MRKLKTIGCAAAVTGGLICASIDGANAADTTLAPWQAGHPATGKIVIEKEEDGGKVPKKIEGAQFQVTPVTKIDGKPVDVTTQAGLKALAKKVEALNLGNEQGLEFGQALTQFTDNRGIAEFPDKPLGLYKVAETMAAPGYSNYIKPFFVTVPQAITKNGGTEWQYEVRVKPKNTNETSKVRKTQDLSKTVGANDDISYTISANVNNKKAELNRNVNANDLNGFAVFDDALKKAYQKTDDTTVGEVKIGDTKLVKGADYTIDASKTIGTDRQRIQVNFTTTGLGKIANAVNGNANHKVTVKMNFKLSPTVRGEVENKFGFIPGKGTGEPNQNPIQPPSSSNPKVKFAEFKIKKVKATNAGAGLADARFKVFADQAQATKCASDPNESNCVGASAFGEKTTKANGETEAYLAAAGKAIYIVETVAPNGFLRNTEPQSYTMPEAGGTAVVENIAKADSGFWFTLPKTGASGIIVFAILGTALVGTGAYMHSRKKAA